MRSLTFAVLAVIASMSALVAQSPGTCTPPGTPTCDPSGRPVPGNPGPGTGAGTPAAPTVAAVTATVRLGGGLSVVGAEGVALDPATGLVYIGLNGTIVGGCEGDPSRSGSPIEFMPGAGQMSILNPAEAREVVAVRTGLAPIWPTVDSARRLVYMMGSGGGGTVTVHNAGDGSVVRTIVVGGKPHMGGLDFSTGLMVVGNTVRASDVLAEQKFATVLDTNTNKIASEFETSPAPHGVVVDQNRDLIYFTAVGDGAIVAVSATTGAVLYSGVPKGPYGTDFGGNNMLARQESTRRLFQVNSQQAAKGILVVDEVTLAAENVIRFEAIPWGLWVDEPNRLLFAALPSANAVGVVDLDTLAHVATVPVGTCPYAVVVDPERRVGVSSNQGTATENASASIFDLCPVYSAANRVVDGCSIVTGLRTAMSKPRSTRP